MWKITATKGRWVDVRGKYGTADEIADYIAKVWNVRSITFWRGEVHAVTFLGARIEAVVISGLQIGDVAGFVTLTYL